jgi:hypothetical protein
MMKISNRSRSGALALVLSALAALPGVASAATANVAFVDPDKFADIGRYGDQREAARTQTDIERFIKDLAARRLPSQATLQIDVLDVNRAGLVEPWHHRPYDVRVMRSATWPSMKLRYRLTLGDQVLASGEESISDMSYLDHPNPYSTDDPLRYEKSMLSDWFQKRLVDRTSR